MSQERRMKGGWARIYMEAESRPVKGSAEPKRFRSGHLRFIRLLARLKKDKIPYIVEPDKILPGSDATLVFWGPHIHPF